MRYDPTTPFHRILATKYDPGLEHEAIDILDAHPDVATLEWPGPDRDGDPFVKGSTVLHYAANDGKLTLIARLIDAGADVNASRACWFRSVLSWAANNARLEAMGVLLDAGARPDSLDALHAAAWGGSSAGNDESRDYPGALALLIGAGADPNDRRHHRHSTPLALALASGNERAAAYLRSVGASVR